MRESLWGVCAYECVLLRTWSSCALVFACQNANVFCELLSLAFFFLFFLFAFLCVASLPVNGTGRMCAHGRVPIPVPVFVMETAAS